MERKKAVAEAMLGSRKHASEAVDACGFACEMALKAVIMRKERFNQWPGRDSRPDLYTHDLLKLMQLAGVTTIGMPSLVRASFKTALSWRVENRYVNERTPRKQAQQMFDSVFGANGVLECLKTL